MVQIFLALEYGSILIGISYRAITAFFVAVNPVSIIKSLISRTTAYLVNSYPKNALSPSTLSEVKLGTALTLELIVKGTDGMVKTKTIFAGLRKS